ncbi:MarR family winged helix-turn-helix transcriptional regulator [Rhizobium lusitanum]|uniref:MarR family winged helix-turn-helix transcriptional regulator n=1 Tax=Rhizobium lusitanum TaxID=293958 RepID=UPI001958B3AB|nr:MarR family transcriptional regulator [Rhizobium lusitanum]MBM7046295.1 MarR family transcriptional regulator [Rhizobium lusitanum]
MTMNFMSDVTAAPGFLIRRCHQISVAIFMEEAAELDMSPTQFSALSLIALEPGADQSTLGERIALDRSSVTKCVERLEKRGLIRREVDPADKRARKLYASQEGREMLEKATAAAGRARARLLAPLSEKEGSQLLALLKQLGDTLNTCSRVPVIEC